MSDAYYSVQTHNYHTSILAELHLLQQQNVMCDVILAAEDGEVLAHKVVLMAASKYFRDKLSPVVGQQASKICLKRITIADLANLVIYMYSGKLLIKKETMNVTLEIAEILQLNGVIEGYKEIVSVEAMKELGYPLAGPGVTVQAPGQMTQPQVANGNSDVKFSSPSKPISGHDVHLSQAPVRALPFTDGQTLPVGMQVQDSEVNTSQASSNEYSFDINPYEQQYMDIAVESVKTSPRPPTNKANLGVTPPTPPKLQQMAALASESQKIYDEEAQHQDLLAVAIETLAGKSSMMNNMQKKKEQPEVEKAVSSIIVDSENAPHPGGDNIEDVGAVVPEHKEHSSELEPFINGKTSTKTVTLNAGKVNNELGGQTEVYTVSLQPGSIKGQIKMPRPMRKKSDKEKKAQETANAYRLKRIEILRANKPAEQAQTSEAGIFTESTVPAEKQAQTKSKKIAEKQPQTVSPRNKATRAQAKSLINVATRAKAKSPKNPATQSDFRHDSPTKHKKKEEMTKIVPKRKVTLASPVKPDNAGDNKSVTQAEVHDAEIKLIDVASTIVRDGIRPTTAETTDVPMPPDQSSTTDEAVVVEDFGQSVNFDSDVDEVDTAVTATKKSGKPTEFKKVGRESSISGSKHKEIKTEGISVDEKGTKDADEEAILTKNTTENIMKGSEPCSPRTPAHDDPESKEDHGRSSSTKRKTRTPRRLLWTEEGKSNDGSVETERQGNIPMVRTRRDSKNDKANAASTTKQQAPSDASANLEKLDKVKVTEEQAKKVKPERRVSRRSVSAPSAEETSQVETPTSKIDEEIVKEKVKVTKGKSQSMMPQLRLRNHTSQEVDELVSKVKLSGKDQPSSGAETEGNEVVLDYEPYAGQEHVTDDESEAEIFAQVLKDINADVMPGSTNESPVKSAKRKRISETGSDTPETKRKAELHMCATEGCGMYFRYAIQLKRHMKKCQSSEKGRIPKKNEILSIGANEQLVVEKSTAFLKPATAGITKLALVKTPTEKVVGKKVKTTLRNRNRTVAAKEVGVREEDVKNGEDVGGERIADTSDESYDAETVKDGKDVTIYICKEGNCMFSSELLSSMRRHKTMFHKKISPMKQSTSKQSARYPCIACDFTASTLEEMDNHFTIHRGETIKCTECEVEFGSFTILHAHQKEKHSTGTASPAIEPPPPKKKKVKPVKKDTAAKQPKSKRMNRTKISLSKLPMEEFTKELLRRHEEYTNQPEKKMRFMCPSLAKATVYPSFPQASPSVRNTKANKLYNMPKVNYQYVPPVAPDQRSYSVGQASYWVPGADNEITVDQHTANNTDILLESSASSGTGGKGSTVLKMMEQESGDSEKMIIINHNGVQSIVRSKDLYQTLLESGQESSQTLQAISSLLEAGEEIEIREQGETVEIQNI